MEDEDEVDVEGDFDINIGMDHEAGPNLYIDINEPPSKSANLQPEYTQHPWMLEQGWNLQLDHISDEKSKAAIEKMLQEEQQYMNGKMTVTKLPTGAQSSTGRSKSAQQKRAWSEEERVTFMKGLEIFGRSWSKIADLIPGKTVQQVKSYGQHYFKMKTREEEEMINKDVKLPGTTKTQMPIGIQNAIRAVTTAQPTVKVSPKKLSTYYSNASSVWTETNPSIKSQLKLMTSPKKKNSLLHKLISPKKRILVSEKVKQEHKKFSSVRTKHPGPNKKDKDKPDQYSVNKKVATMSKLTEERSFNPLIEGSEIIRIPKNSENDQDDSDVDIDIDIESDDDITVSKEGESQEVDMVYKKLVESSGIKLSEKTSTLDNIGTGSKSTIGESRGVSLRLDKNELSQNIDNIVSCNRPESLSLEINSVKYSSPDPKRKMSGGSILTTAGLTKNLERYPSIGSIFEPQTESSEDDSAKPCDKNQDQEVKQEPKQENDMREEDDASVAGTQATFCDENEVITEESKLTEPEDNKYEDIQSTESLDDSEEEERNDDFGVLTSDGETIYLPNPDEELVLEYDAITDVERRIHCEFFTQKPGAKTPDRYLKIRNFILDAWDKSKPQYLNKTSVRPGLKNCGDVNCIGRIHSYLEQVGAINFGCNQVQYRRPFKPVIYKSKSSKNLEGSIRGDVIRSRKRRVRDITGDWIDEKDLEGKTFEHKEKVLAEKKYKTVRVRSTFDPFKLIPCLEFNEERPAPYEVHVETRALVIMDVHSHLSKTEVIGLLGGEWSRESRVINITHAVPCNSLSTGMQCEMDPVSQTEACDLIQGEGRQVVGWYHSHPTFIPNPSCRDIETQVKYQDWFGKGGNPFIGIIVSPYCQGRHDHQSIVRCLMVINNADTGLPYEFKYTTQHRLWNGEYVEKQVGGLVEKYSKSMSRVQLLRSYSVFSQSTCLEKMIDSVTQIIPETFQSERDELSSTLNKAAFRLYTESLTEEQVKLGDDDCELHLEPPSINSEKEDTDGANQPAVSY